MCGFCLLDILQMLATKEAARRGLPKGSLFLAGQTVLNLQQAALGIVSVALTKDERGSPWSHGDQRLSELPTERHFGHLRSQSPTAQHTATSFWRASARKMMKSLVANKAPTEKLPPLTPDQLYRASERAYGSALRLASFCQGASGESLHSMYTAYCSSGSLTEEEPLLGDEDEFIEELEEDPMRDNVDETQTFLQGMQAEAAMQSAEAAEEDDDEEEGGPSAAVPPQQDRFEDPFLEEMPDGAILKELFSASAEETSAKNLHVFALNV